MIKTIITDFSRVLLFPKDDSYKDGLNALNNTLLDEDPNYSFLDFFKLNTELLSFYAEKNKTIPVHIFTGETIQDHPAVKDQLTNSLSSVLSALNLGIHKSEAVAYKTILEALSVNPEEVIYIDDKQSNLEVAATIGIETILFVNNQTTIDKLEDLTR